MNLLNGNLNIINGVCVEKHVPTYLRMVCIAFLPFKKNYFRYGHTKKKSNKNLETDKNFSNHKKNLKLTFFSLLRGVLCYESP